MEPTIQFACCWHTRQKQASICTQNAAGIFALVTEQYMPASKVYGRAELFFKTTQTASGKHAKKRVRAYKEDWVTRAITAEVKVHQLQVENNKLREALAAIVGGVK